MQQQQQQQSNKRQKVSAFADNTATSHPPLVNNIARENVIESRDCFTDKAMGSSVGEKETLFEGWSVWAMHKQGADIISRSITWCTSRLTGAPLDELEELWIHNSPHSQVEKGSM
eukprot:gene23238-29441_t